MKKNKILACILSLALVVTSLSISVVADDESESDVSYTFHGQYMYMISVSTGQVVCVDESTTGLIANGDISMTEDVESMPDTALFDLLDSTDDRFVGYVALKSVYNDNTVSARNVNEGGVAANGGTSTTGWEVMRFTQTEDGTYAIRTANGYSSSVEQGAYVTLDSNNHLIPGSTDISTAERFYVIFPEGYEPDVETTTEAEFTEASEDSEDDGVVMTSSKKGVSSWWYAANASEINIGVFNQVGATWVYNWGITQEAATQAQECDIEYVPMIWGSGSVTDSTIEALKEGKEAGIYENLLTFNEPDLSDQANMSVDEAIALWPQLEETGLRLGSPAGAAAEDSWVEEFMTRAEAEGLRVDFLTVHVYQDFTNPASVQSLKEALERLYEKYQIPIWITEIGNVDVSTQWYGYSLYEPMSHTNATTYITEVCEMLETLDYVERYAWFVDYSSNISGTAYTRLFNISDDSLTEEGKAYSKIGSVSTGEDNASSGEASGDGSSGVDSGAGSDSGTVSGEDSGAGSTSGDASDQNSSGLKKAKIKKATSPKKSIIRLKIKKVKKATGYQIRIYKNKKKAKKNKQAIVKKTSTKRKVKIKSKKLKGKKKVYVRVRAYATNASKNTVYGKWSKVKKVKMK